MNRQRGPMQLLEDAMALCAEDPAGCALQVAVGVALSAGLAWAQLDLLRNPEAAGQVGWVALGLALAHASSMWLQARQASALRRTLGSGGDAVSAPGQWRNQAAWQPWALLGLPLAALTVLGLAQVSAFFCNVALLDDGTERPGALGRRAWALAGRAPLQAQTSLAILAALGLLIFGNLIAGVFMAGKLAKVLLGADSVLTLYPDGALNGTFFILCLGSTWALLRPVFVAMHILRWSEGEAGPRGEDLALRLRNLAPAPGEPR
ncbi:MAG TPA: hypothetical protein VNZ54_02360 [bacterium]|nr:hypothetical protein [bacterium]